MGKIIEDVVKPFGRIVGGIVFIGILYYAVNKVDEINVAEIDALKTEARQEGRNDVLNYWKDQIDVMDNTPVPLKKAHVGYYKGANCEFGEPDSSNQNTYNSK